MYENLVAVTNRRLCERPFLEQIERLAKSDITGIILREKDLAENEYEALAREVLALCAQHKKPCVLHNFVAVARRLDHPRIHLPLPLLIEHAARGELKGFTRIGTSIHAVEEVALAERCGAAYLTAGHIYATDCKCGVPPRGLEFLRAVTAAATIPVYAIGGITLTNLPAVLSAGAAGACIMSRAMRL